MNQQILAPLWFVNYYTNILNTKSPDFVTMKEESNKEMSRMCINEGCKNDEDIVKEKIKINK